MGTARHVILCLAAAAGLDVASNLETDPEARGLLPARLVHEYQIIPIRFGTENTDPSGANEPPPLPSNSRPLHLATAWLPDEVMADPRVIDAYLGAHHDGATGPSEAPAETTSEGTAQ